MRYGRTSIVNFLSQLAMSFAGFFATIALTRTLGADRYGAYVVVLAVLSWLTIAGNVGLSQAIKKRVSEAAEGNYVVSGLLAQFVLYVLLAVVLLLARPHLNAYMGIDATLVLVGLLGARLAGDFVQNVLDGQRLVHVSSVLSPIEWTTRSVVQVALVLTGFGLAGAFAGYAVGALVAVAVGSYFLSVPRTVPTRQEFRRLKSYAQFSWLASVQGRTFLSMDTVVLAIFVANDVIAVYEIAWNVASLFAIFGSSIRRTLFPEMSRISSENGVDAEITDLLRTSLTFSGLFIVPGLVGSAIVGDVVLSIYGPEFRTGYYILLALTVARLIYSYQGQFLNTIDAVDRPDLTFRINAVFVGANLALNVALISAFGWYGAATATTVSAALGLGLGYRYARRVVDVVVPFREVLNQWLAAAAMAVVVLAGRLVLGDSLLAVVPLVGVGAAVYFGALLALSGEFRAAVERNLPDDAPIPDLE
ncbi:oligosaccharide flippase family protein [Natronococcus jeotgali]|uniref:oligosaccharide flippase family protein n=1 Tax=Natronococcus jeotgali TaxID=413812 RepID=UPI000677F226|nr:polysaccharide biosynthesis C-terminal domain-containing protein [Natronococcus jeotgali]